SRSPGLTRSSRARAGLAALGIVLAGAGAAAAVVLGKRASLGQPAPSALPARAAPPASAALPVSRVLSAATSPALPAATPSAVPAPAHSSGQPLPTPRLGGDRRGVPAPLGKTPAKTSGPARDPY